MRSRIHAIGWSGLFNGFKSEKDKAIEWTELLPYQLEDERLDHLRISKATAEAFVATWRQGLVPSHVVGAMADLLEEIQELTGVEIR